MKSYENEQSLLTVRAAASTCNAALSAMSPCNVAYSQHFRPHGLSPAINTISCVTDSPTWNSVIRSYFTVWHFYLLKAQPKKTGFRCRTCCILSGEGRQIIPFKIKFITNIAKRFKMTDNDVFYVCHPLQFNLNQHQQQLIQCISSEHQLNTNHSPKHSALCYDLPCVSVLCVLPLGGVRPV